MILKIEPIKPGEVSLLADISRKTFYDTFHQQNSKEDMEVFLESAFTEEILQSEMSGPSNYFFFARLDDEIAGHLKLSTTTSLETGADVLEICRLYVIKEKLGAGVGKALMEFAISFAKKIAKKRVCLGVWEHNARAINFYKSFGFEKFGEHVFMVGNDPQTDWLMKRELLA